MNLRRSRSAVLALLLGMGLASPAAANEDILTPLTAAPFLPATTPVLGTDREWHFVYELELANAANALATLNKVEVMAPTHAELAGARHGAENGPEILAEFSGDPLLARLRLLTNRGAETPELEANESRLFLIDLSLAGDDLPADLQHRLSLTGQGPDLTDPDPVAQSYQVAPIAVARRLPVLEPPLRGSGWVAVNGCCGPGGHRASALPVNGKLHFAQRFAIDWVRLDGDGRFRRGPVADVGSYVAYGVELHAVADGVVVSALDGLPDQTPPQLPDPSTITLQNVDGNHVVLDIGGGFYAFYAHLKPGSVRVEVGDSVRAGQVLGLLGNSGNTSAPHLHFHLMDGESVLGSEGVPYVLSGFTLEGRIPSDAIPDDMSGDFGRFLGPTPEPRRNQFPLDGDVVDFSS